MKIRTTLLYVQQDDFLGGRGGVCIGSITISNNTVGSDSDNEY